MKNFGKKKKCSLNQICLSKSIYLFQLIESYNKLSVAFLKKIFIKTNSTCFLNSPYAGKSFHVPGDTDIPYF